MSTQSASKRRISWGLAAALLLALAPAAWTSIPPGEISVETPVYRIPGASDSIRERLTYRFAWSGIPVATVTVTGGQPSGANPRRLEIHVRGQSNAFLDLFWRYRLNAEASIPLDPIGPGRFFAEEAMKRHRKTTRIEFDENRRVRTHRNKDEIVKEYEFATSNTFDLLSTVLTVLNMEYEVGDTYQFDTLTGSARFLVDIEVQAKDEIEIAGAPKAAYRLRISTAELTDPEDSDKHRETLLWVSAEKPRRLLKASAKLFIGSVYAELESVEQLETWPVVPPRIELNEPGAERSARFGWRSRR